MNCRRVEHLLHDELERLTSECDCRAIEAHLAGCPTCRQVQEELLVIRRELRELAKRRPTVGSRLDGRAIDRWLGEREAAGGRRQRWLQVPHRPSGPTLQPGRRDRDLPGTWARSLASVVTALLLALLAISWLGRGGEERPRTPIVTAKPPAPIAPKLAPKQPERGSPDRLENSRLHWASAEAPGKTDPRSATARVLRDRERVRRHEPLATDPRLRTARLDDLALLNRDPKEAVQEWVRLRQDEWEKIEARVRRTIHVRDDFVTIPFPRIASTSDRAITQAVESYKRQAAIVDPRLSHEVTCAFKGMALSDVCEQLKAQTGIQLSAGPSVADEKVTVFCENLSLRDVMRQLSRPFGYTWLRSGTPGLYRYELVQDLKSQLLEEELRNRDSNAALLDVDRQMEQYREYLRLTPDQALARAASAPPEEKKLLEYLAGKGWGPAQLYFQLTPADLAALRAGEKLSFNAMKRPLPPDLASGVMASLRDYRVTRRGDHFDAASAKELPDGMLPASTPEARPMVSLSLDRSELGQLTLRGFSGFYIGTPPFYLSRMGDDGRSLAVGMSLAARAPENAVANAALAHDPALQERVTVRPGERDEGKGMRDAGESAAPHSFLLIPHPSSLSPEAQRLASADVLEALHRACGMPIVADYYTRLFPAASVSASNQPLFEALNHLADAMRMRWRKEGSPTGAGRAHAWLEFRSVSFYNDRLKEVPNRLLSRWANSRREHGALTLDDLIEIAGLSDAQLDSSEMAEGARELFGLDGWDLTRRSEMRSHWHFLATLTREQLQLAQTGTGLPFTRMSLAQQQQFLAVLPSELDPFRSLVDLGAASLQVDYTTPGEFQWLPVDANEAPSRRLQEARRVRARTREAVLEAARRIDPRVLDSQISPTEYTVALTYRLGGPTARLTPFDIHAGLHSVLAHLPQPVAPQGQGDGRTALSGER
jgi:hypothetical protein